MWTPRHFASPSPLHDFQVIDEYPFGLFVTRDHAAPVATHAPMLVHPEDRERATSGLTGIRILGHLARENSQWESVADGDQVLLIFQGPQGYVSPTVYADEPAAPTWNYVAVHLTGPIRLIHEHPRMLDVIDHTIDATERYHVPHWNAAPSRGYHERIVGGVVAFEVEVTHAISSHKLSQDQPPQRRQDAVADALRSDDSARRVLGEWMRRANGLD
ncbi:MAG: FMN-binding negative transcriptional regulator [Cryobacterium sp.]|nr:FMN-binding negative transcriptional regulator [Cryobacterium sp.]